MIELVERAAAWAEELRGETAPAQRRRWGQYFTPPSIARFMAGLCAARHGASIRLLDPGAGAGILGIAAAASLLARGAQTVELIAVEQQARTHARLERSLARARAELGPRLQARAVRADVLELPAEQVAPGRVDLVIANPPYFKMPPSDARGGRSPNIYTRFMEVAARLLKPDGELCCIVPRSYASGRYFEGFRRSFHAAMALERVHVFASRRAAFRRDGVLQENIIVRYRKRPSARESGAVLVTSSRGAEALEASARLELRRDEILDPADSSAPFLLPTSAADRALLALARRWPGTLATLGLEISTGPVIPFRAREQLTRAPDQEAAYPLLWMQHVRASGLCWPLGQAFRKPEYIRASAPAKLLVPRGDYVLLRRLSSKEERRRLIAATLERERFTAPRIGIENHVNFIHRPGGALRVTEARGLAALLNSRLLDRYFRMASGSTQVNATDIRRLPLPASAVIDGLGRRAVTASARELDAAVDALLRAGSPRAP